MDSWPPADRIWRLRLLTVRSGQVRRSSSKLDGLAALTGCGVDSDRTIDGQRDWRVSRSWTVTNAQVEIDRSVKLAHSTLTESIARWNLPTLPPIHFLCSNMPPVQVFSLPPHRNRRRAHPSPLFWRKTRKYETWECDTRFQRESTRHGWVERKMAGGPL